MEMDDMIKGVAEIFGHIVAKKAGMAATTR
jgi:hypothetical protein